MSKAIKNILCAISLTEASKLVMMAAFREAWAHDSKVHVLHVIPSFDAAMALPIASFIGEEKFVHLMEEKKDETMTMIREKVLELKDEIIQERDRYTEEMIGAIHVVDGDPVIQILNMADALKPDMFVIGSHAKGFTEHTIIGSVAKRVLKRVRVPCLVVPPINPHSR